MKVKELIRRLEIFPPNDEMAVYCDGTSVTITDIVKNLNKFSKGYVTIIAGEFDEDF